MISRTRDGVTITFVASKGGGKGGSQQSSAGQAAPRAAVEAPNSLRSKATARILEALSEGPVKGLVDGLKSVYLDKTPVLNPDGSANFTVSQFEFRHGDPSQDVIPGFAAGEAEKSVGVTLEPGVGIVRRVSPGIDAVRVKIRANALYLQQSNGDIVGNDVNTDVAWNIGGAGWVTIGSIYLSGKTMSAYERALRIQLPKTAQTVDIRLTRTTPNRGSSYNDTIGFSSYTEIVDGTLTYDDTAMAGLVIDSQYFPNVPSRGYLLDGILCQVPTNYDPETRVYSGDWDGTFKSAWTNNPAWVFYEIATNPRFGAGRDIDGPAIDKWGLYECAVYNDELVPDGNGGTEPRFTCNAVFNTSEDSYKVLNALAANMRALLYYANGTIFVIQDRPIVSFERVFSPANVTDGLFDYMGADYRSQFNAVEVTWSDPSDNYEPAVALVQDPDYIATQPYRDTQATAFATTSEGQAIRYGRWIIYTGQNETEIVSFRTSLENADVRPGMGILIQDPSRVGVRLAGRTLDQPAADMLELDAPAKGIEVGWKIFVTVANTVLETTVTEVASESLVRVSGLAVPVPAASMWLAHDVTIEPTPWRVSGIKEDGANSYSILATQYAPGKFAYVDEGVKIPPPPYSLVPTGPLVGPTDMAVKEYIYLDASGTPQFGVVLSWEASTDGRVASYTVDMTGPAGDARRYDNVRGVSIDVPVMRSGNWTAYVTANDNIGRRAIPLIMTFNTIGLTEKPLPPVALYAHANGANVELEWIPTEEIDVAYYWLAWHPATNSAATWQKSTTIATRISRQTLRVVVPSRPGTYFIKTIDSLGQESRTAARSIVFKVPTPVNQIVNLKEQPLWDGTLGIWRVVTDNLVLDPPTAPEAVPPGVYPGMRGTAVNAVPTRYAYYYFDNTFNSGVTGPVQLSVLVEAYGARGDTSMSTWVPLAVAVPLATGSSNDWDVSIEVRGSIDNGATWAEWKPIKTAYADAQMIQARLVGLIYDLQTTLRVVRAEISIDVSDRTEDGRDTVIAANGRAVVVYATGFYQTPNLQLTSFAPGNSGGSLVIIASDKSGFTVEQRKDNGQPLGGGSFNWLATGFGVS